MSPSLLNKILSLLISLCIMDLECRKSRPYKTYRRIYAQMFSGNFPAYSTTISVSAPPSISSTKIQIFPFQSYASVHAKMLSSALQSFIRPTSFYISDHSSEFLALIIFKAKILLSDLLSTLYIYPWEPLFIWTIVLYISSGFDFLKTVYLISFK